MSGQNQEVSIGTSIGIATFLADAQHADTLVKLADSAMYSAKQVRNTFRYWEA